MTLLRTPSKLMYGSRVIADLCLTSEILDSTEPEDCPCPVSKRSVSCNCCGCCEGTEALPPEEWPWYDPNLPVSTGFYGFLVDSISSTSAFSREIKSTLNGASISDPIFTARVITVRLIALSNSESATSYGVDLLNSIFMSDGNGCNTSLCLTPDLEVDDCCSTYAQTQVFRKVKLLSAVVEEPTAGLPRCCGAVVTVTLGAEVPYKMLRFKDPIAVSDLSDEIFPMVCCSTCTEDALGVPEICVPTGFTTGTNVTGSIISGTDAPQPCYCRPLLVKKVCAEVLGSDLNTSFVNWKVTNMSGSALKNITVQFVSANNTPAGQDPFTNPENFQCATTIESTIGELESGWTIGHEADTGVVAMESGATSVNGAPYGTFEPMRLSCSNGVFCVSIDACNNDISPGDISVEIECAQGVLS